MLKPKELDDHLPGFDAPKADEPQNEPKNNQKKKKSSGAFQSMGLSFPVLKGITKRGYKQPTPIQRKTIPIALTGKDVVAMARTGSGKTACFVLPILEKLLVPNNKPTPGKNLRALILSPTRELALQTLRFVRELGKFTGLTSAAILGGESIEQQFNVMSGSSPDIVVATPGRFLHICIEMCLKLDNIKIVVFDEADRLFELGFGEQLQEICARLPSSRQTLLFSATLPKMLVEFARAGLSDPTLIRLDVDWKLPSTLWLGWISVRAELKTAALLILLDKVLTPTTPQAVVFAATKHHVEYLHLILQQAGISSTYAYSGLDPSARKIALGRFTNKKCSVLIVTDVAARGLDLPALDTVINYNFPAKPKLFVHRTILELSAKNDSPMYLAMKAKKLAHGRTVEKTRQNKKLQAEGKLDDIVTAVKSKKKKKGPVRDENYIPHQASDQHTETGMAVNFSAGAEHAQLELRADSGDAERAQRNVMRWDRKRKKMVHVDPDGGRKMIRTESGFRVPASFRSGRFDDWKKRNLAHDHSDDEPQAQTNKRKPASEFRPHWVKHNERVAKKAAESKSREFRDKQQIVKERMRKDKIKQKLKFKGNKKKNKRKK
ncbi:ATP-dependent RNA helicase DDX54-like protein [Bombyx mori]|uniref:RNA helicase n=1 Tax=Bombyx mori TaxID=7091 RepID=H2E288_BOMMO|nr:ATP-dependent RNA helicase DDX54-like protein [Bombyx mori]AEY78647.1 ATP-dependent RNA helicase DDX54-like protein [Bombyx mori]